MTYREQFDEAMKCETPEDAEKWLAKEVTRYWEEHGEPKDEAIQIIRSNLGYMAGYYDDKVARKVHKLFAASHPVFGEPGYHDKLSAENCVELGRKMASRKLKD